MVFAIQSFYTNPIHQYHRHAKLRRPRVCVFAIYLVAGEEYDFDDRNNDGHSEHGSRNPRRARSNQIPCEFPRILKTVAFGIALDSSVCRGTLDLLYGISINFWFTLDGSNIFL